MIEKNKILKDDLVISKQELRDVEKPKSKKKWSVLTELLFIRSWNQLLETNYLTYYLNQPVQEIVSDCVIQLPFFAWTGLEATTSEPFIFLEGPGIYFVQFRLMSTLKRNFNYKESLSDFREFTGLVLPLNKFEKMQTLTSSATDAIDRAIKGQEALLSKIDFNPTFEFNEYCYNIPFAHLMADDKTQRFFKALVKRHVVHPYRFAFNQLLRSCTSQFSFRPEEGLKILSGGFSSKTPVFRNEILIETQLLRDYSRSTAGIKIIHDRLDRIAPNLHLTDKKTRYKIFDKIRILRREFIQFGYPLLVNS